MSLNTSSLSSCPEHLQLLALAEGTLSEDEATVVANHVADCRACDVRLDAIEEQSDDLVRALAMLPASLDDEETFQTLQAELLATPATFGQTDVADDAADTLEQEVLNSRVPSNLVLPIELGNYELLEQIGTGANGAVFRARHRRLEKQVAVKLLINVAGPAVEEFLNEMRVIGKLDHPNVIQATDAGEHDGIYFLVMEFVPGLDVSSLLRKHGPLSTANACEIARQTALGLSVAHQHDLVHRDVKTSNLLFTSAGQIKLLDLGLATISSRKTEVPTEQSGPRGTADYMAPEQWREANAVTAKADIYSLGCTLFKLLTGAPPFRPLPDTVSSLEEAHISGNVPDVLVAGRSLPSGLDAYLRQMLAKDPGERPDSAREVATQLAKYTAGANLPKLARRMMPDTAPSPGAAVADNPTLVPAAWSTRRLALFSILGGLGALAWNVNRTGTATPSIVTGQWRPLLPANPPLIPLTFNSDAQHADDYASCTVAEDVLEIQSPKPVLLQFGRPLTGAFRYRATLQRDAWTTNSGIVFRLRAERPREFQFQAFEILQADSKWWLYWNSYRKNVEEEPTILAEATLSVQDVPVIELEVVLGVTGFPDFYVNGTRIAKSEWILSKEARTFVASHTRQIAATYAGRVGVLHHGGTTTVRSPKLMYINRS